MSFSESGWSKPQLVDIDYTNYRGDRAIRTVMPIEIFYGTNKFHPGEQWLLLAHTLDRDGDKRTFAMRDIHSWKPHVAITSK